VDLARSYLREKEKTREKALSTGPHFEGFLKAHHPERPTTTPTSISTQTLGISKEVVLQSHTLYLETLTTTLYISSSESNERGQNHYFHLFDSQSRRLGIVDLNIDPGTIFNDNTNSSSIDTAMKPVHVAILSGPSEQMTATTERLQLEMDTVQLLVRERDTPKLYQVMLLREQKPLKGELRGKTRLYERVGLGEVVAVMLERMEGLKWQGILLQ
jgi:hypothetical protein